MGTWRLAHRTDGSTYRPVGGIVKKGDPAVTRTRPLMITLPDKSTLTTISISG